MRIDKSQLQRGAFITLDCGLPAVVHKRAPPKYGDPPNFKEITARLRAAEKRLAEIREAVRQAREGK